MKILYLIDHKICLELFNLVGGSSAVVVFGSSVHKLGTFQCNFWSFSPHLVTA